MHVVAGGEHDAVDVVLDPSLVRMPTGLTVAIGQSMSLQLSRCNAGNNR